MILKEFKGVRSLCVADHNYKSFLEREIYIIRMKKKINSTMKFIERYDVFESEPSETIESWNFWASLWLFRELQIQFLKFSINTQQQHKKRDSPEDTQKWKEWMQRKMEDSSSTNANPIGNEWKLHV